MKKILVSLLMAWASNAFAAGGGVAWDRFPKSKMSDMAALQSGAKVFVNYCLSCHAAAFHRYNRLKDIGLSEQQIKDNLLFTSDKVGETMKVSMDTKQAKDWFGATPPDLTVIARSRADGSKGSGADYLYTLWRSYYRDPSVSTGWNNLVFQNIGMPHVLWELQGERKPVYEARAEHGHEVNVFKGWEVVKPGAMSPVEYDDLVGDLVAYLQWMGEPMAAQRYRLGVWVLLFLGVLTVFAWRLNTAFWKDVK